MDVEVSGWMERWRRSVGPSGRAKECKQQPKRGKSRAAERKQPGLARRKEELIKIGSGKDGPVVTGRVRIFVPAGELVLIVYQSLASRLSSQWMYRWQS